jgi:hypothetical protein
VALSGPALRAASSGAMPAAAASAGAATNGTETAAAVGRLCAFARGTFLCMLVRQKSGLVVLAFALVDVVEEFNRAGCLSVVPDMDVV